jgi:hypothetical protein
VQAALNAEPPDARDQPAADLALAYADAIDRGAQLHRIGPALLAVFEALQMSPRARALARVSGGPTVAAKPGRLDELRARRARKSNPENLDTAAP